MASADPLLKPSASRKAGGNLKFLSIQLTVLPAYLLRLAKRLVGKGSIGDTSASFLARSRPADVAPLL